MIDVYNKNTGDTISYAIGKLPENIFDASTDRYEAKITFRPNVHWIITVTPASALANDQMPGLTLSIVGQDMSTPTDKLAIALIDSSNSLNNKDRVQIVKLENSRFSFNGIPEVYEFNNITLKTLSKDLLENQLLQL
ncbi:hypothetical protein ACFSKU_20870 [Pontibacter silvestris]|uniref:Uncharacterized protein n=1 Tax=Pontibacter silvestris TaxID=2305183 RepID=A0ABW4X2Z6_9BACT|nr:hypothetical protein [Pontibacter silvestris]MCC9137156.1 hypothetical protein [Pontibacter silvestris]